MNHQSHRSKWKRILIKKVANRYLQGWITHSFNPANHLKMMIKILKIIRHLNELIFWILYSIKMKIKNWKNKSKRVNRIPNINQLHRLQSFDQLRDHQTLSNSSNKHNHNHNIVAKFNRKKWKIVDCTHKSIKVKMYKLITKYHLYTISTLLMILKSKNKINSMPQNQIKINMQAHK